MLELLKPILSILPALLKDMKEKPSLIVLAAPVFYMAFLFHNSTIYTDKKIENNTEVITLLSSNLVEKQIEKLSNKTKKSDIKGTDIKYVIELCYSPIQKAIKEHCDGFSILLVKEKTK